MPVFHRERHYTQHIGWLRAAVSPYCVAGRARRRIRRGHVLDVRFELAPARKPDVARQRQLRIRELHIRVRHAHLIAAFLR